MRTLCAEIKKVIYPINYLRVIQSVKLISLIDYNIDAVLLDLGAGPMNLSLQLKNKYKANIIAMDLYFPPERLMLSHLSGINMVMGDGQKIPLKSKSVDCIVMSSILHMVQSPEALLFESKRVLKQEGYCILCVPNEYQFIPKIMKTSLYQFIAKALGLPRSYKRLLKELNRKFAVKGPKGYYSIDALEDLLSVTGFEIVKQSYNPGVFGSLLWECGVLLYLAIGNIAFHLLVPLIPIVKIAEKFDSHAIGSEHIIKVKLRDNYL